MRKVGMLMVTALAASLLAGCGYKASDKKEEVTITVFAAKSLNQVMEELIAEFQKTHENVNVQGSYDSSGTLMERFIFSEAAILRRSLSQYSVIWAFGAW